MVVIIIFDSDQHTFVHISLPSQRIRERLLHRKVSFRAILYIR